MSRHKSCATDCPCGNGSQRYELSAKTHEIPQGRSSIFKKRKSSDHTGDGADCNHYLDRDGGGNESATKRNVPPCHFGSGSGQNHCACSNGTTRKPFLGIRRI